MASVATCSCLVCCSSWSSRSKVADVSLELLTKGRVLADTLGCELEALAIGSKLDGIEKELAQ